MADINDVLQIARVFKSEAEADLMKDTYSKVLPTNMISFCDAVIELLKEQEKLVNVDKLREKLGFAESCEKCKNDSWRCQRDTYFSEMDFCDRLDYAIEELTKEGR